MFNVMTTLTIGLNYGAPAGDRKGQQVPLIVAQKAIAEAMKAKAIDCYTIIEAKGYWMGEPECSLRVEVMHNDAHAEVTQAARQIKEVLLQEAVLVVHSQVQGTLV